MLPPILASNGKLEENGNYYLGSRVWFPKITHFGDSHNKDYSILQKCTHLMPEITRALDNLSGSAGRAVSFIQCSPPASRVYMRRPHPQASHPGGLSVRA